jgi:hypothetical protein
MLVEYPDRSVNPVVYAMASQYLLRPGDRVVPLLLPVNICKISTTWCERVNQWYII